MIDRAVMLLIAIINQEYWNTGRMEGWKSSWTHSSIIPSFQGSSLQTTTSSTTKSLFTGTLGLFRTRGGFICSLIAFLLILSGPFAHGTDKNAFDFSLYNFDGKRVTSDTLRGKVVLLTFSYAYCSVRCPLITARLLSLDERMNAPKDVVYLHVSVDPEMDTPERRINYFSLYGIDAVKDNRWMFVSGHGDELIKIWQFYGIDIKKTEEKRIPEGYYMEYTPKIVIINKRGTIAYEADFFFMEEEMARKMGGII